MRWMSDSACLHAGVFVIDLVLVQRATQAAEAGRLKQLAGDGEQAVNAESAVSRRVLQNRQLVPYWCHASKRL